MFSNLRSYCDNYLIAHIFVGMGDLKIHDISYLPDPCPLPEQIKKRALIEKEKLVYAPFSGVGGIVYDKDAVYLELGGSHSHNKQDDGTDDITNLIDTKDTLDTKMEHSELQLLRSGKKLDTRDFDSESDEEEGSDTLNTNLYEQQEEKEQSDLQAELEALAKSNSKYKEEKVENSGRIRRKVIFDISDEELEKNISEQSDDETTGFEENNGYTTLKSNKNDEIHGEIKGVLKNLENRNSLEPADLSGSDDDSSGEELEGDNTKSRSEESDESFDDAEVGSSAESDAENEDLGLKWKENLAKKAEDAFMERQASTKNLMKLVYG